MIVLINGGPALDKFGPSGYLGRLVSPRAGNSIRPGETWAADNDALKAWDEERFIRMLSRVEKHRGRCLFVAAPDVITVFADGSMRGDRSGTIARFQEWRPRIKERGLPIALVGQDGMEDLEIPWGDLDAFFVGGSTEWKLSTAAADLIAHANRIGKWTHMGRVNSQRRLRIAFDFGCQSVDGTGWSMFPDKYLSRALPFMERLHRQTTFFQAIA